MKKRKPTRQRKKTNPMAMAPSPSQVEDARARLYYYVRMWKDYTDRDRDILLLHLVDEVRAISDRLDKVTTVVIGKQ